jgi:hypothetical protein
MAPIVLSDFDCAKVYDKTLTQNDMTESSRLYIKDTAARRICPQAFGSPPNESEQITYYKKDDLSFVDAGLCPWPMVFHKRGNKCYLTGGWSDFVTAKKLCQGDTIIIHEYTCKNGTGKRFFMIGSILLFGRLIG